MRLLIEKAKEIKFDNYVSNRIKNEIPASINKYIKKYYGLDIKIYYKIDESGGNYNLKYSSLPIEFSDPLVKAVLDDATIVVDLKFNDNDIEKHSKLGDAIYLEFKAKGSGRNWRIQRIPVGDFSIRL